MGRRTFNFRAMLALMAASFVAGSVYMSLKSSADVRLNHVCLGDNDAQNIELAKSSVVLAFMNRSKTSDDISSKEIAQWLPSKLVILGGAENPVPDTREWSFEAKSEFGSREISIFVHSNCSTRISWQNLKE